jgi:glucose-6-phosphate 1-dehydrogenase
MEDHVRRHAPPARLLDAILGDGTLFIRRDEVEASWAWIDAIETAFGCRFFTPGARTIQRRIAYFAL